LRKAKSLDKVRYGFIGAGAIAQRRHLPEAQSNPRAVIVAVADTNANRVKDVAGHFGATAYTDYRQMLDEAKLDAVVVCGPNALHAPMTIDALASGRHVLCEKPMATTLQEARHMIEAAERARRRLMIAMNQRFMPHHARAKQIIDSGRLGRPLTFRTVFAHAGPEAWSVEGAHTWFFDRTAAGVGVLGDLGVHKIDLMHWLIGQEFVEVGAEINTLDKQTPDGEPIELDDNAHLVLRTRQGVVGSISLSWTHYGRMDNHTLIGCQSGVLSMGLDSESHLVIDYRNGDRESFHFAALGAGGWPQRSGVIDAFTDCLIHEARPPVDGRDGLRAMHVVLTGMQAAKERKTLKISH
jgi:UDP-N-acetylglucosamine 3-dehydrogenase